MTTNRSSRGPLNSNSDRSLRARYADGMARPRTSSGPAVSVPHQKAVHMTAPNRLVMIQNHPLPNRGRPHMTLMTCHAVPGFPADRTSAELGGAIHRPDRRLAVIVLPKDVGFAVAIVIPTRQCANWHRAGS